MQGAGRTLKTPWASFQVEVKIGPSTGLTLFGNLTLQTKIHVADGLSRSLGPGLIRGESVKCVRAGRSCRDLIHHEI